MALRGNATFARLIYLLKHKEKKRCAEDVNSFNIEKDDAGALFETFVS